MSTPRREAGFTWYEVLVLLGLLVILASLALTLLGREAGLRSAMSRSLSNMRQLQVATQSMAQDHQTTGDRVVGGWPGDMDGTFTNWMRHLVPTYVFTNDFCKLVSGPGKVVPPGELPKTMAETAVWVYAASSNSPVDTVFLTSGNFLYRPAGKSALDRKANPYGDKGFVVFRTGGDGAVLTSRQVGATNLIGTHAPLCR